MFPTIITRCSNGDVAMSMRPLGNSIYFYYKRDIQDNFTGWIPVMIIEETQFEVTVRFKLRNRITLQSIDPDTMDNLFRENNLTKAINWTDIIANFWSNCEYATYRKN